MAVHIQVERRNKPGSQLRNTCGSIVLLPPLETKNHTETVSFILEEWFQLPQEIVPPKWAAELSVPLTAPIQRELNETRAKIAASEARTAVLEKRKAELNKYKKLVYSDGKELEEIFARCLRELGGTVRPAQYAQEEYVLEYNGEPYLIECKGNKKSISLTDLRQLFDYLIEFEDKNGKPGKGILFGNAWKELPPAERGTHSTVLFPDNVKRRVSSFEISLVSSVDFFHAFMGFLEGKITGDLILSRITATAGVVDFST